MIHGKPISAAAKQEKEAVDQAEIERKKAKFKEFLKVMGVKSQDNKQSWNDSFASFMADDASGLQHTNAMKKRSNITVKDKVVKADKKGKKENKDEEKKEGEEESKEEKVEEEAKIENEIDVQRLYIMNLPFTISHDDLRETFGKYGEIEEVEVPLRRGGTGFGFAFLRFATEESAVLAFASMDKKFYQGRKLHILPAQKKPPKPIVELAPELIEEQEGENGVDQR